MDKILVDMKFTATGARRQVQPLTIGNVKAVLKHLNLTVRLDMMSAGVAFFFNDERVPEQEYGMTLEIVNDTLIKLDVNATSRAETILTEIAQGDKFHPMEDALKAVAWDGKDRMTELSNTIKTDNPLWPTYLENWLVQVVDAVCGWRRSEKYSLPYVLVLVGGQGCGKTRWLGNLGGQWIKTEAELHLSSPSGKDHQIDVLRRPMAELAELDGIFRKSDISHMKSFISREEDAIRAPFARRAIVRHRMTVFCGSVNETEFLNDSSGSRRFWPVGVDSITWGFDMDWTQLWAQAYSFWQEDAGFDLNADEDAQRERIATQQHQTISVEAETVITYYEAHAHLAESVKPMNVSEIMEMLGHRNMSPRARGEVGRVLVELLGKHRSLAHGTAGLPRKKRAWMFPFSEFARDQSLWPGKSHLTLVEHGTPESE